MWKIYSLIGAVLMGMNNVLYKYALKLKKSEYELYSCFILIGVSVFGLTYLLSTRQLEKYSAIPLKKKLTMALMSGFFFGAILFFYKGLPISPNISLNTAIYAGVKIATVFLVTCLFFKEILTLKQFVAVLMIGGGICLLSYK